MHLLSAIGRRMGRAWEAVRLRVHYRHRRQQFDRMYANGDAFQTRGPYEQHKYRACLRLLGIPGRRYGRALEIGAAEGALTEQLAPHCGRVTALELSREAARRAAAALAGRPHVTVQCGNIADIRSWPEPWDLLVASDVLYYLGQEHSEAHLDAVLHRFAEWVAPGGRILLVNGFRGDVPEGDWFHREMMLRYRRKLEGEGLSLVAEEDIRGEAVGASAQCVASVLERPREQRRERA